MIRKVLYTVVVLLMVGGTAGWAKPTPAKHCVIFLEPIQPGETESKASQPVCSTGKIDSVNGKALAASFLIARFYDNINYVNLLIEYYGASACSSSISYGRASLASNLNDKFDSGKSYSNCNNIYGYQFTNYAGTSVACDSTCNALTVPGGLSSWRVTN
jgi:hypothetical protein